jgi:hypothetical protein
MELSGQFRVSAALLPRKEAPGVSCMGGWVSLRAGLDRVAKRKIPAFTGML